MTKDFRTWLGKKEQIDEKETRVFFHEREIWFAHLGANVGFEQDGKGENFGRPLLIFRKFNNEVFWGVPLTTREKGGKFYLPIELGDGLPRKAILSQLRLFDAKRLYQKLATVDVETHKRLEAAIIKLAQGK
ncbi:type II toxin-antitoxin system PemK/MazF family toxin [bacterium]|nr:type II toxin-antitoxin system PemK/MazF family toxin [bacterium]